MKLTHLGIFTYLCYVCDNNNKKAVNLRSGGNGEGIRERDMEGVEKRKVKVDVM